MTDYPSCTKCRKNLPPSSARCYINAVWWCGDCLYVAEYGPVEMHPKRRGPRIEQPSLFDSEQYALRQETTPTHERNR